MAGESDKIKGRAKQAAGDLTGDEEMAREGERDETAGDAKDWIDNASEKAEKAVDDVRSKMND